MAVKLTPAGVFGKWILAPVVMVLLGYFVVGPRIGKPGATASHDKPSAESGPPNADPEDDASSPKKSKSSGPDVDVTVAPAGGHANNQLSEPEVMHIDQGLKTVKPKHHKFPKKDPDTGGDPPERSSRPGTPDKDEGGSAGATTAG